MAKKLLRILILEDDLETLAKLMNQLSLLEQQKDVSISVIVLSEYWQVFDINANPKEKFDLILLDRDCKLGGSFHVLDLNKFSPDRIIGISSVPDYNEELKTRGVKLIVNKDYQRLDEFAQKVGQLIEGLVGRITL